MYFITQQNPTKVSWRMVAAVCGFSAVVLFAGGSKTYADSNPPDQSFLTSDGPAAAKTYAHAKKALNAYSLTSGSLPDVLGGSGVNYDVDAVVEGRFGVNGQDMLLLAVGGDAIDAEVPHDFSPDWLNNNAHVRFIVRDAPALATVKTASNETNPASQPISNTQSSVCTILAAAPDTELTILAGNVQVRDTTAPLPSRGGNYRSYSTVPDAGKYAVNPYTAAPSHLANGLPMGHPIHPLSANEAAVYPYYRYQIYKINHKLSDPTLDKITTSLLVYSDYYRIDPRLVMAMIIAESSFDPNSTSNTGAMGLGQLMPGTAAGLISNPYDPVQNVGGAVKILSDNVKMYGGADSSGLVPINTLLLTMAAYNAGNGAVQKYHGIPPYRETQVYVRRVAQYYKQLCGQ